jgi:hypothetical protein
VRMSLSESVSYVRSLSIPDLLVSPDGRWYP